MNKTVKTLAMGLVSVFLMSSSAHAITPSTPQYEDYTKNHASIMEKMKHNMGNMVATGDINIDFLTEMTAHHSEAVDMAKNELKNGSNADVKKLAIAIVNEQSSQLTYMASLLKTLQKKPMIDKANEANYMKANKEIQDKAMMAMDSLKSTGDVDKDFLGQMLIHHSSAVDMAKNILNFSKNPDIRKLANDIIANQSPEITIINQLLSRMNP